MIITTSIGVIAILFLVYIVIDEIQRIVRRRHFERTPAEGYIIDISHDCGVFIGRILRPDNSWVETLNSCDEKDLYRHARVRAHEDRIERERCAALNKANKGLEGAREL